MHMYKCICFVNINKYLLLNVLWVVGVSIPKIAKWFTIYVKQVNVMLLNYAAWDNWIDKGVVMPKHSKVHV